MKYIKTPLLFTGLLGLLTSCSNNSIAGTYGFQMGKANSTHFGIYLKLTDDMKKVGEIEDKYKACEFSFTMKFNDDDESTMMNIIAQIGDLLEKDGDAYVLPGFYCEGDKVSKDGEKELKVGFDLDFLKEKMEDIDKDIDFPTLEPEMIEKLIYTTYLNDTITMYVPVGQADALFQLYWYGVDVAYTSEGLVLRESPTGVHDAGTHPTEGEIAEINKTYKEDHEKLSILMDADVSKYRDFYTLAMGLNKKS